MKDIVGADSVKIGRGDANKDGTVDILDVIRLACYLSEEAAREEAQN